MKHIGLAIVAALLALPVTGCVSANEADFTVEILDHSNEKPISDCLLLAIRSQSTEKSGSLWVVDDDMPSGAMIPRAAFLRPFSSGDAFHQSGSVVMLLGPYAHGETVGWEYWLIRPGYQPDRFYDVRVARSKELGHPVKVRMLRAKVGRGSDDERYLDLARQFLVARDLLAKDAPDVCRLAQYLEAQLAIVKKSSYKKRYRDEAAELQAKLTTLIATFPPAIRNRPAWTAPLAGERPEK